MRQFKFRAWVFDDEFMVNESYSEDEFLLSMDFENLVLIKQKFDQINGGWCGYENCKHEIMQYTGLKDKNGVEIYEGDIVSCEYLAPDERYVATGEVVWCNSDSAQYKVNDSFNESDPLQEWYSGCEVIGNIYENPELLNTRN